MRTTIDAAGRVVIPKAVRDAARLEAGTEIEVELRDGLIELVPVSVPMRIAGTGRDAVVVVEGPVPALSVEDVRDVLERTRR